MNNKKPVLPVKSLLDDTFVYVPASKTDIRKTFAKFGFIPKVKHV